MFRALEVEMTNFFKKISTVWKINHTFAAKYEKSY